MNRDTALTAKPLTIAERKARVAALVKEGKLTPAQAALIGFQKASPQARAFGATLADRAKEVLARKRRATA